MIVCLRRSDTKSQRHKKSQEGNVSVAEAREGKNRREMEKVVRYHIPAAAVACSEYPGEIPEADHMVTIEDRLKIGTTWSILLNYILQRIIFPLSMRKFGFMLELHKFSKRTLQENKLLF